MKLHAMGLHGVMLAGCLAAGIIGAGPAMAGDALLEAALDNVVLEPSEGWAFTRTKTIVAEDTVTRVVQRFDPSRPPDEQVEHIETWTDADDDGMSDLVDDDMDPDLTSYKDIRELVEGGVERIKETETQVTYGVIPVEGKGLTFGDVTMNNEDIAHAMSATVVVQKTGEFAPYVSEVHLSTEEAQGNLLAKIKLLDLTFEYAPIGSAGTMLMTGFDMTMDMSALMFIDVGFTLNLEFEDFEQVGIFKAASR